MQTHLDKLKNKIQEQNYELIHVGSNVILPIIVFDLSTKINADNLVSEIFEFRKKFPTSMSSYNYDKTYVRAWHSDFFTHKLTNILDELLAVKKEKIKHLYKEIEPTIYETWINIYHKGDQAVRHRHSAFGLASVYYPYVEENPTPIIFDGDNDNRHEIVPKKNMLIIFHSMLYHAVPEISENQRISIASNFNIEHNANHDPFMYHKNKGDI